MGYVIPLDQVMIYPLFFFFLKKKVKSIYINKLLLIIPVVLSFNILLAIYYLNLRDFERLV